MSDRAAWDRHPGITGIAGMLLEIHDSFRATSAALLLEPETAQGIVRARRRFLPLARTLHHHHHAEEVMLFPLVQERTGARPQALLDDHTTLMARLDEVEAHLERGDPAGLGALLAALDHELREHLDREEALAMPVLLALTPAEIRHLL